MGKSDFMEEARTFSYGVLGNELESVLFEVEKGNNLTDGDKAYLMAGIEFFDSVIYLEEHENESMGVKKRIDLLSKSDILIRAWTRSMVNFPKNDPDFLQRLKDYSNFLRKIAQNDKTVDQNILNNLMQIFSAMGEISLYKMHTPVQTCYL